MLGAMGVGQTAPYFEAFALARGAAGKIFSIIERVFVFCTCWNYQFTDSEHFVLHYILW